MFDECNIVKLSFLWEAINAFTNPDKDCFVNKEVLNLIIINGILGEIHRGSYMYSYPSMLVLR